MFRVMFVCTANHCRSPMAQQLLAQATVELFGTAQAWQVGSAGTAIPGPWPLNSNAATVLAERLPAVAEHQAVQLDKPLVSTADLILTATRDHRGDVVRLLPAAMGRTFTILQFARLCDQVAPITSGDPDELGRTLLVDAKKARSTLQPVPWEEDDLSDPMGFGLPEFRKCADQLQDAISRILRPLKSEG